MEVPQGNRTSPQPLGRLARPDPSPVDSLWSQKISQSSLTFSDASGRKDGSSTDPDPRKDNRLEDEDCAFLRRALSYLVAALGVEALTLEHLAALWGPSKVSWRVLMAPSAFNPQRGRLSSFLAPSARRGSKNSWCCLFLKTEVLISDACACF